MVERHCTFGETQTLERRYYINSIDANAQRFAQAVCDHSGVENRLHWRLDVVFDKDASRIRTGNAPAIMTSIRHLGMNLFDQEPTSLRLAKKRRKAPWNEAISSMPQLEPHGGDRQPKDGGFPCWVTCELGENAVPEALCGAAAKPAELSS